MLTLKNMVFNNARLKKLVDEYSYPYKSPWIRVAIHCGIAFIAPFFLWATEQKEIISYLKLYYFILSMDLIQGVFHNYAYWRLNERYDWIKNTSKRFGYSVLFHTVITFSIFFFWGILNLYLTWGAPPKLAFQILANIWYLPILFVVITLLISNAGEFLKNWKKSLVNEEKLRAEMMSYKYESLRSQMNPHFLFNSFNVLANLVNHDQKLAVQFIQQLSQLYRNVLDSRDRELISLKEELKFIESYIFLLKIRFENKLNISVDVPIGENELIVPMVLQSLIENAVKHNAISKAQPLDVSVVRNNGRIIVSNTIRAKKNPDDSSGMGLQNIKQRYRIFTEKEVEILNSDGKYAVSIPVLQQD